ncbi:phosphatidate cytidylyltransferase [Novosphingobium sp.]|uniref:phosphatidate cytidylyltransferase n=1 Tax=Novosphingobium sp. TaxID=1874826 RepID=UPI0033422AE5
MTGGSGVLADAELAAKKRSDLPVRVASAVVMVAVAGGAFWLGGWFLVCFIVAVGLGIFAEWTALVLAFEPRWWARCLWQAAGLGYIGLACAAALSPQLPPGQLLAVVLSVIAVDVGAYFAGRTFGGPKIAPAISPSKTWSGLLGGVLAASAFYLVIAYIIARVFSDLGVGEVSIRQVYRWGSAVAMGTLTAIIAQSGDFFESWMKRRAGVKDSGRLIPGHGGLFDRADGLLAVLFTIGILIVISSPRA